MDCIIFVPSDDNGKQLPLSAQTIQIVDIQDNCIAPIDMVWADTKDNGHPMFGFVRYNTGNYYRATISKDWRNRKGYLTIHNRAQNAFKLADLSDKAFPLE